MALKKASVVKSIVADHAALTKDWTKQMAESIIAIKRSLPRKYTNLKKMGKLHRSMTAGTYAAQMGQVLDELEKLGVTFSSRDINGSWWKFKSYMGKMKTIGEVRIELGYNNLGPICHVVRALDTSWNKGKVIEIVFSTRRMIVRNKSLDVMLNPKGE
jgi:hypothetical protein